MSMATVSATPSSIYEFKPRNKSGQPVSLEQYRGKVLLIVNTASKCGFTGQYEGLQTLYTELKNKYPGQFEILGFPCNQFGDQEPGSNDDIQSFCKINYGVTFPIMGKIDVNGDSEEPLFSYMKASVPGMFGLKRIKWNFEKFLIDRTGQVRNRWSSITTPKALEQSIIKLLEEESHNKNDATKSKVEL